MMILAILPLLATLFGTGPQPTNAPTTIGPDILKGMVVVPERWYAGYHLRAKLTNLWELVDKYEPRTIRVTPTGGTPYWRVVDPSDGSKPFRGGPPGWSDFSFDCGTFPEGKASISIKVEVFQGLLRDDEKQSPIATAEVTGSTMVEGSLDALALEPFCDKAAASKVTARFGNGGLYIDVPEEPADAFALSVRVFYKGDVIATGAGYTFKRDPRWQKVGIIDLASLSNSPLELTPTASFEGQKSPARPLVVEIVGDPEVALRAGFKKYWAGRVTLVVK
jgi:hypothetical protein